MPSPFPGMDPYLEDPGLWPGLHNTFADRICTVLNSDLPKPYYAQLEMRNEMGILGEGTHRVIVPDVSVQKTPSWLTSVGGEEGESGGGLAIAARPRTEVSPSVRIDVSIEALELASVAIRDSSRGRELVTLIEIVSPSNKRPGPDRDKYLAKLDETLASATSLVEIDLLRSGTRSWTPPRCQAGVFLFEPPADYVVVLNRAWQRGGNLRFEAFPVRLQQMLPVVPVPLREGEAEPPLDLQFCFQLAYDGGPYRRGAVDYSQPPAVALPEEQEAWRAERLRDWRERRAPASPSAGTAQDVSSQS